jgi:hypothetical protein
LHAKEKLNELAQKYDNIKSIDKLGEANRLLDGVPPSPRRSRKTSPTALSS